MKKILLLGFILTVILTVSASAQVDGSRFRHHREARSFRHGELTHFERRHLRDDEFRHHMAQRRAHRDGFIGRHERRRLAMMRMHERHELYRYNHNNRHRLI